MAKIRITAQKGSTLYDLAKVFGTSVEELRKLHNMKDNVVQPGQVFEYDTKDVEGVKTRMQNLQAARQKKYDEDKKKYDDYQAKATASKKSMEDRLASQEDYGDLNAGHIKDYTLNKKEKGWKSVDDYKKYLADEHKSNMSTIDLTRKAALGIGAGMLAAPILANPGVAAGVVKTVGGHIVRNAPSMIRDAVIYDKVIDPATTAAADKLKLEGTGRSVFKNAIGFGTSGITSKVLDRGAIKGVQALRNMFDDVATNGTIFGKNISNKVGKNLTKAADKLDNTQTYLTQTTNPLRSLNVEEGLYDAASTGIKEGLAGAAYGLVEEHSPLAANIVAPLTTIAAGRIGHGAKRFAGVNSGGQKHMDQVVDRLKGDATGYQGMLHNTTSSNRRSNGQKARYSGLELEGGMNDVAHKRGGDLPIMERWAVMHKGNKYNSPHWNEVNPRKSMASKLMRPYENSGWMDRRAKGDAMNFYSPQPYNEFERIAKSSKSDTGESMYDYLMANKLNYDVNHLGDINIAKNSNKALLEKEKQILSNKRKKQEKLVANRPNTKAKLKEYTDDMAQPYVSYNQNGNRQASQTFKTADGQEIHLGSDFGGTGSGGGEDAAKKTLKGWLVKRLKSSMDLGSYSLPVTGQIIKTERTKTGALTNNNVTAYREKGLPVVDAPLQTKRRFHFFK